MHSATLSEFAHRVLRGEQEYVTSHAGGSQYSRGGVSACGLAALNCARITLHRERSEGMNCALLLQMMMQRAMCDEILDICLQWTGPAHLEVEDVYNTPLFEKTLSMEWSEDNRLGPTQIQALLQRAQATTVTSAIVITRPPEILTVIKLSVPDVKRSIFVSFDSHPRHKHPQDPAIQWQAQLLEQYSAHVFIAKDIPQCSQATPCFDMTQAFLGPTLQILALRSEIADFRARNHVLDAEIRELRRSHQLQREQVQDYNHTTQLLKRQVASTAGPSSAGQVSRLSRLSEHSSSCKLGGNCVATTPGDSACSASSTAPAGKKLVCRFTDEVNEDNEMFATMMKFEWEEVTPPLSASLDASEALAAQEQCIFEEEDRQLRAQMEELKVNEARTFDCGICFESFLEDSVARLESCSHPFCRPCMFQYIRTKLTDRKWPMLCPSCSIETDRERPGLIDVLFAQQFALTEQDFMILTQLELAPFSVQIECRGCGKATHVDRIEYEEQNIIACPLPGCTHAWCQICSQSIDFAGPPHSCDGTSELNHLMNQRGWRNCPGCGVHTSKTEGCNHMTCITPSCNTHFCYLCGESIIRSVHQQEVRNALGTHYARCRIIDVPEE